CSSDLLSRLTWLITDLLSLSFILSSLYSKSTKLGVAISAAADGVGALISATKSHIVKSVSCPTADIIGIFELKTSLATISSLNDQSSSIEPPPLPTIIMSTLFLLLKNLIPSHISYFD